MCGWFDLKTTDPRPLGPKEMNGLLEPPAKVSTLPTDHLITGQPLMSYSAQEKWFKSNQPYISALLVYLKLLFDVMTSSFWVKLK